MPRVTDFTKAFDVTPNTVRAWSKEFSDYLSSGANPAKGKTRSYSDEDAMIISMVAELRATSASFDEIRAALDDNDRGQWPPAAPDSPRIGEEHDPGQTGLITRLTATVAQFEGELGAVKDERDRLLLTIDDERQARLSAEVEAARAAGQLEAIYRQSWYQFWKPKKPGD